ncbi:MAG: amidohydrolase, partial [Hymenobacteraceae bacterium]|nr:amidohydrolase [Hymenobacteraceae bacterium]MDX5394612.1 amidohydrolase [Hymenobacteraceae bacterium]MDX5510644.1 amidohydrolase [Hymenobacteraceae bacterium]
GRFISQNQERIIGLDHSRESIEVCKNNKYNVVYGKATDIPFTATATHHITDIVKYNPGKEGIAPKQFTAKAIRHGVTSPDEKTLVFNAAGYLWKKELPSGQPERITSGTDFEFYPAFSPDGKTLVYTTWNDEEMSAIQTINLKKRKPKPEKLTTEKGFYTHPSFSPDGSKIVFQKEGGNYHQGYTHSKETGIYWIPAKGGAATRVQKEGSTPRFSADGKRIFFTGREGENAAFKSVDLSGKNEQTHFTSKYAAEFTPSPDNKWIAFGELFNTYIAPFPQTGSGLDLSANTKAIPVARVTRDAGTSLHWSADSKKLHWLLGEEYFTNELKQRFNFLEGAPDSIPPVDTVGININLVLNTDVPQGKIAFTNARIITMNGDEVIENGTLVVEGNRIVAVGKTGEIAVPKDTKTIDAAGKTIMPGLVDVHAHLGTFRLGMSPQKQWSYYANLAYGVTT